MNNKILLSRALRLNRGVVVSFVGAGGKTTAMFRLAAELVGSGWRVVSTTTTRIALSQVAMAPAIYFTELERLSPCLDEHGHCLVVGAPDGADKVHGITSETVEELHHRSDVDVVLVEADGSRQLPLKAPAEHEPVVPAVTTHLVPIAGVDIIEKPLDAQYVHRPERVAELTGVSLGSAVTCEIVARVLAHQEGGAKRKPAGARLTPLVNKIENETGLRHGRAIAEHLLKDPNVDSVVLGSVRDQSGVVEVCTRVAGIVLAAGTSTRFGAAKQLLPYRNSTLVGRATRVALEAGLSPIVVVTGHERERVAAAVAGLPVTEVFNPDYLAGQNTSVRSGVASLPASAGAAIFLLADQPAVKSDVIQLLVQSHRETLAPIAMPTYEGRRGNPILFDRETFAELQTIAGDVGGRVLFSKYQERILRVPVTDSGILQDIDTPEDYERLRGKSER